MSESQSQELFDHTEFNENELIDEETEFNELLDEPPEFNEDELINELLAEENEHEEKEIAEKPAEEIDNEKISEKNTKLPLSRIKTLMKMDPDLNLASQESVFLVSRATEMFLKHLAQETYFYTSKAKRKTVQRRDVDAAIENIDAMCFLEGALD